MKKPIETACELYQEMKRRGLHLRNGNGRDDALLAELAKTLGISIENFAAELKRKGISAEDYLLSFLAIAEPFAVMFQEIWDYLQSHAAPKASETIAVKFGFPDDPRAEIINLEQFRRYAETSQTILISGVAALWDREAMGKLFELGRILGGDQLRQHSHYRHYEPGKPFELPPIDGFTAVDQIVRRIRNLFQKIIDDAVVAWRRADRERNLPEYVAARGKSQVNLEQIRSLSYSLTDLLPTWLPIFLCWSNIRHTNHDRALQFFHNVIEPLLKSEKGNIQARLLAALDVLDLPFWKHRWHTYEIWASILSLKALEDYMPDPRVFDGHIGLDGQLPAVVAGLRAEDLPRACVAVQVSTPYVSGMRRAIKPDMRLSLSEPVTAESTCGIIEFKQRTKLDSAHVLEVLESYDRGSPHSGGVVMANYDDAPTMAVPGNYTLVGKVRPGCPKEIEEFADAVCAVAKRGGLRPVVPANVCVLLDVSGSMGVTYATRQAQQGLSGLLSLRKVKIYRFNDGLVEGGDLHGEGVPEMRTSGGTELGLALRQLTEVSGTPHRLLIVTDGGHDHPNDLLEKIPALRECRPDNISEHLDWLVGREP